MKRDIRIKVVTLCVLMAFAAFADEIDLAGTWNLVKADDEKSVCPIAVPIFEADFHECSYGFRPNRNAKMAVERIAAEIKGGK